MIVRCYKQNVRSDGVAGELWEMAKLGDVFREFAASSEVARSYFCNRTEQYQQRGIEKPCPLEAARSVLH